jgi:histidine triad (HIT) family protein
MRRARADARARGSVARPRERAGRRRRAIDFGTDCYTGRVDEQCTFCRILARELPKVFLDERPNAVVFLDRNQAARGHLLIVPRHHVTTWDELDEATAIEIATLSLRWARILRATLGVTAYNLLMNNGAAAGQDTMHAHLHVTPRVAGDGYYQFGGKVVVPAEDEVRALEASLLAAAAEMLA